jgi:predicted nucleic acid-binding protein
LIVYLDTNIIIYFIQNPPGFGPRARARLTRSTAAGDAAIVSHLSRMECRVGPLRAANPILLGDYDVFFNTPGLKVVDISAAVCDRAATIRATHNFKPMDALQLAAAVENSCDVFLTNDVRLNRFAGITIEVLP